MNWNMITDFMNNDSKDRADLLAKRALRAIAMLNRLEAQFATAQKFDDAKLFSWGWPTTFSQSLKTG